MKNRKKKINQFLLSKFLQYGLHLGGLKSFWNPKMKVYLTGFRNSFGILDLSLTHRNIRHALKFLSKVILSNKKILFIGGPAGLEKNFSVLCKKHGHYCLDSFPDGFFTNFKEDDKKLICINSLEEYPSVIVFFDLLKNEKAKKDILNLNIPILTFVNTSDNLDCVDYSIPANIHSWKGGLFVYNLLYSIFSLKEKKCGKVY